jgi:hypothetical protein
MRHRRAAPLLRAILIDFAGLLHPEYTGVEFTVDHLSAGCYAMALG